MRLIWSSAALTLLASGTAWAKDDQAPAPAPPVYQAVVDCRTQTDPAQRLACYDRAVEAMAAAQQAKQLVVADQTTMREARRGLFGLSLPRLKLFGDGAEEELTEIESTITGVRAASDGFAIFQLEDGTRWKQTDGRDTFAKSGQPIKIRRTAMGGYMANVNKQTGVRVVRLAN